MWKRGIKLSKVSPKGEKKSNDYLIMETRRVLKIDNQVTATLSLLPKLEYEWAVGYAAIHKIPVSEITIENGEITISRSENDASLANNDDGKSYSFYEGDDLKPAKVEPDIVIALMSIFQEKSLLYKDTAMTHSVGFTTISPDVPLDIPYFSEELYAEGAFYKSLGLYLGALDAARESGISSETEALTSSFESKLPRAINTMVTSEKLTSIDISRCSELGIRTIISRFAPTDRAYDLANSFGISIFGFARGLHVNVY
jgi:formate dehydrogenase assembly factor FdhD